MVYFFAVTTLLLAFALCAVLLRGRRKPAGDDPEEIERVRRQAENNARDLLFARLFTGGYFLSDEDILEDAAQVNVSFPHGEFVVVAAQVETWGILTAPDVPAAQSRRERMFLLRNALQTAFDEGIRSEAVSYGGQTVAVVNYDNASYGDHAALAEHLRERLQFMVETMELEFGLTITAAVSRPYASAMEIQKAYRDTQSIVEYIQVINEDFQVVFYEDLTHHALTPPESNYVQLQTKLLSCYQLRDFEGVRQIMHEMVSREFEQTRPTIDIFRFRVYGMVNTMLYMLNDLRATMGEDFQNQYDPGPRLAEAPTLNDFMLEMDQILDDLKRYTQQQKKEEPPAWVVQMQTYVQEHYMDVNVTVSFLAEQFNMSPSYCSRVFKQYVGVRLFDYIQTTRLEAAKALLDSPLSVKEIAERVGFSSTLTMNRAFKRHEGACPSKFRSA